MTLASPPPAGAPVASMPMYDPPEARWAVDAWWAGLARAFRAEGLDAPDTLVRPQPFWATWRDPALLFSQTCGYPLMFGFERDLRPIATPCYAAEGCEGPLYRSAVVVRKDAPYAAVADLQGAVCAMNGWESHSGMNALRALVAPHARGGRFFARVEVSGGHRASMAMVGEGRADVAAIDAVTLALNRRHNPAVLEPLRILCWTDPAPGLPLVTRAGADDATVARLYAGILSALADPALAPARDALLITGIVPATLETYRPMVAFEERAKALGYPVLA